MEKLEKEFYEICPARSWAESLSEEEIINHIKNNAAPNNLEESGKDYCYWMNKDVFVDENSRAEHVLVFYALEHPDNLENASRYDIFLNENETFELNKLMVYRDGNLLDKISDTEIKVLDNEEGSSRGMLHQSKKLNFSIKDLHLGDIIVMEDTKVITYQDKNFLLKNYFKHVFVNPNPYWYYGVHNFKLINGRATDLWYEKFFFRDENGKLLPHKKEVLKQGEVFTLEYKNYNNNYDADREVNPFIDFATVADWKSISNYVYPLYKEVYDETDICKVAPDLIEQIDALNEVDEKIQFAIEYVQNNIYYIFNSEVMNGHRPQAPEITYKNKQGDCKAKTVFLKLLLDYIGIKSSAVLVNYDVDYYIKYYSPSPLTFNHVILKIYYQGKEYLVDPTHRNEYGRLKNRSIISLCFYLEIMPDQTLNKQKPFEFEKYALEERLKFKAKGNTGKLIIEDTMRYNRADIIREQFRNRDKREILDSWNSSLFYALNFHADRPNSDPREIFKNAIVEKISDNKILNEIKVRYEVEFESPYFIDKKGNRFLEFFDFNDVKEDLLNFNHKDFTFWHYYDSEYHEFLLETDQKINTKEKYTIQECNISNEFMSYKTKKHITKHSGKMTIKYYPIKNIEIPREKLEDLKSAYQEIKDSNFGIGIDVIEPGIFNFIKHRLKN